MAIEKQIKMSNKEITPEMEVQFLEDYFLKLLDESKSDCQNGEKYCLKQAQACVYLILSANPHNNPINSIGDSSFEWWNKVSILIKAKLENLDK